jgi:hypothetical protein
LPSGPSLIISYFSTNLDGTAGVWERSEWLVPRTAEATGHAGWQLRVGRASPAARAAHGCRRSPELQLSIEGVLSLLQLHPVLVRLVLLDLVRTLLLVRRVLLLRPLLLLHLLPLEVLNMMVLLQLKDKNKRLLFISKQINF